MFYGRIHCDDSIDITSVERNRVALIFLFFAEVLVKTRFLGLGVGEEVADDTVQGEGDKPNEGEGEGKQT